MAIVTPLPMGGLGTEIGSLTQRLQLLQVARAGVASMFVTTSFSVPASGGTWQVPTQWPALTVGVLGTGGAFVIAGCTVLTPASGTVTNAFFGIGVDTYNGSYGNQGEYVYGIGTTVGKPNPLQAVGYWPISGGGGAPVGIGDHDFSPQIVVNGSGSLTVENLFLVVVPL